MSLLAVNFHYFRETQYAAGIYPTSRAALEKQIDALHRRYKFVSQEVVKNWIETQQFPVGDYCLLTMDDGLKEQLQAFDFLYAQGIPSLCYVPTDPIRTQKVLPVHQLHYIRTQLSDRDLFEYLQQNSGISDYVFDEQVLENQYRYDEQPARRVKYFLNFVVQQPEKEQLIDRLFETLVADPAAFARDLYMDENDLRRLAAADALGSHGSAHLPLATLSQMAAEKDITDSIHYLQSVTGRPIVSFSYPFGGADAVNDSLAPMLERAGIRFAFTMQRGFNTTFDQAFFLRRVDTNDAPGGKDPLPALC